MVNSTEAPRSMEPSDTIENTMEYKRSSVTPSSGTKVSESMVLSRNAVETFSEETHVEISEINEDKFSFRTLWAFTGPGFLMSIAYLDPGNIESDLQSGATAKYKLLWIMLGATFLGLLMQRLSARLGVVTGDHLARMCYKQYKKVPRLLLWIMVEIAIVGSDMQEVIGTAIALYLLSNRVIPIWAGVLITIVDTFTFLLIDRYGLRKLELFFGFLMLVMAVAFGYEYGVSDPPQSEVLTGLFTPWCQDCGPEAITQAIGIVGAILMPHNLYLHSALVTSRKFDRKRPAQVKAANRYYLVEISIALLASVVINVFVVSVFGYGLFGKTNADVYSVCEANNFTLGTEMFENNAATVEADLYHGGIYLGCQFGAAAMYIWAVGILASGQSSTMTGTYAGQFAMEGFLNIQWARWKRVLVTRLIAVVPTLIIIAFTTEIADLSTANEFLNAVMSLQLPFAAIPTIAFTSDERLMGQFKNGLTNKIIVTVMGAVVVTINIYFVIVTVQESVPKHWAILLSIAVYSILYILFCIYLVIHMAISMGATRLNEYALIAKYVNHSPKEELKLESP